jgi:diacylglycerol kinase family enzyme
METLLVINPRSGDERPSADELRAEAERRGIGTHVLREGEDAREVARSSGAGVLGVAGGDGSIGALVEVALESGARFFVVPFGTRNHFARDIGLDPDDPLAALAAFEGRERRIDVGRVNGRAFVNNVSLGLYARLVRERERRRSLPRSLGTLQALLLALRHPRPTRLRVDGGAPARLVLVANNAYSLQLFSAGGRECLDAGHLCVYESRGILPRHWHERAGTEFRIDGSGPVQAAVDGEPTTLDPPLELGVEAGALRLLLPLEPGA